MLPKSRATRCRGPDHARTRAGRIAVSRFLIWIERSLAFAGAVASLAVLALLAMRLLA